MPNSVYSRVPRSAPGSGDSAELFAGETHSVGGIGPRLGEELLKNLPGERRVSDASTSSLAEATYSIGPGLMDRLSQAAATMGASRNAFFLTTFAVLLARLAGQESITLVRVDETTGFDTRLTLTLDCDDTFRSLLTAVLREPASVAAEPCAVQFVSASSERSSPAVPKHAMRMTVEALESATDVRLASTTGRWDEPVLQLWLRYFDYLLAAAVAAPLAPWKTLPLLDQGEAYDFYRGINDTSTVYSDDGCVHQLVAKHAGRTPDAVAIISESRKITYRELDQRSDAIARQLRLLGAGPDRPVAICLERTAELPIALVAVLKAGSCYVPLNLEDPSQRRKVILEECRPAAIILDSSSVIVGGADLVPAVHLDTVDKSSIEPGWEPASSSPDDRAYIIYTSGTTGKPKGVSITHRALANLLFSIMAEPGFTASDRILAISPISFDIATMEMFLPLVSGGTVVVADRLVAADPFRLAEMLSRFQISVLQATPVTWRLLAFSGWQGKRGLKMISGGEALSRDLADRLLALGGDLWNCYGPTETTIYSGVLRVPSEPGIVPIGPPIANTTFYVLDDTGRLLPRGCPGNFISAA